MATFIFICWATLAIGPMFLSDSNIEETFGGYDNSPSLSSS